MSTVASITRQSLTTLVLLLTTWGAALLPARSESKRGVTGSSAPSVNVFYKFPFDGKGPSGYSHGKVLYSELIQGADGNFYGTTANGGSGTCSNGFAVVGCGTIF